MLRDLLDRWYLESEGGEGKGEAKEEKQRRNQREKGETDERVGWGADWGTRSSRVAIDLIQSVT